jgi:hypothetical protein
VTVAVRVLPPPRDLQAGNGPSRREYFGCGRDQIPHSLEEFGEQRLVCGGGLFSSPRKKSKYLKHAVLAPDQQVICSAVCVCVVSVDDSRFGFVNVSCKLSCAFGQEIIIGGMFGLGLLVW